MPKGDKCRADDTLALNLAAGKTVAECATAAGVSVRTVQRRLTDPTFSAKVAALRSAALSAALGKLTDGATAASEALTELMKSANEDVKHRAAVKVLELGIRLREHLELDNRLAAVEEALKGTTNGDGTGTAGEGGEGDQRTGEPANRPARGVSGGPGEPDAGGGAQP